MTAPERQVASDVAELDEDTPVFDLELTEVQPIAALKQGCVAGSGQ